jgi:poly(A) polymerase
MRYRYSAGKDGKLVKKASIYTREEHGINSADVDIEAVDIIRRLKRSGFETYIVGGAVRDLILGKKPKDFDIVSSASPAKIKKIFRNSRIIGRRFRLVHIYFGQRIFEVSTFRSLKDGTIGNTFGTIDDDVYRRDFTMNALFYDPEQEIVVDYVGGVKDIKNREVKPIIALSEIFTEDPVRMIRAVKYAAMTGFSLPVKLKWKIKAQVKLLSSVSPSRLTEEISKIIHSSQAVDIVDSLDKMGLYFFLQPQAARLMRKDSAFRQRYLQTMASLDGGENYRGQALGALFYDYLETAFDWQNGAVENYKEIFQTARSFVLPMNPARFEMESALRKFLSARGITIKRTYIVHETAPAAASTVATKRRRRRKAKHKPAEQTSVP